MINYVGVVAVKRVASLVILSLVIGLNATGAWFQFRQGMGGDWQSFLASGYALRDGLNPYAPNQLTWSSEVAGVSIYHVNLNPPISLLALGPLAYVDPGASYRLWVITSMVLLVLAIAALLWRYAFSATPVRIGWALALAGLWDMFGLGQIYAPIILLVTLAWLALDRDRLTIAGLLLGLVVAVKPNFGIWPLFLFISGYRRPALISVAIVCLVSILPVVSYGPMIYLDWLRAAASYQGGVIIANTSIAGVVGRLGLPWLHLPLAASLVLAIAWHLHRHPQPLTTISGLGLVTSLLASPLAWVTYTVFMLPVFLSQQRWTGGWALSAALLVVPAWLVMGPAQISPTAGVLAGLIYHAALWCLLIGLLQPEAEPTPIPLPITPPGRTAT